MGRRGARWRPMGLSGVLWGAMGRSGSPRIRPLSPDGAAFPFTAAAGIPAVELSFDEVMAPRHGHVTAM